MEQNLGPFALSIIGGKLLQGGSTTQEYREFMKALGPVKSKELPPEVSFLQQTSHWLTILGNGYSLLLVCWIVCQLWYNGSRIIGSLEQRASLGMLLRVLCCGIATFIINPKYIPVSEAREDQERLQDRDINLINIGPAGVRLT